MATYLLIHGANQGGWIWTPLASRLRAAGHNVYHPTLEGSAERSHAARAGLTLDTQGSEIAGLLFYEDLTEVIVVATSVGGMVAARAAELARERIRRLVFVDALVPTPGESASVILNRPPWDPQELVHGQSSEEAREEVFAELEPGLRQWAAARYTLQPRAPHEEPVDLRTFWSATWQVDVLRCRQSPRPPEGHQRRTAELLGGRYQEIDAGHYLMLSHPDELAAYLLAMA
jgi:pimeloyl-ACP methyl ester carboxylesterase